MRRAKLLASKPALVEVRYQTRALSTAPTTKSYSSIGIHISTSAHSETGQKNGVAQMDTKEACQPAFPISIFENCNRGPFALVDFVPVKAPGSHKNQQPLAPIL
jgi:hypothetical protein